MGDIKKTIFKKGTNSTHILIILAGLLTGILLSIFSIKYFFVFLIIIIGFILILITFYSLKFGFLILILLIPLAYTTKIGIFLSLPKLFGIFLFIMFLLKLSKKKIVNSNQTILFIFLFIIILISALWSDISRYTMRRVISYMGLFFFYFFIINITKDEKFIKRLIWFIVIGGVYLSVLSLISNYFNLNIFNLQPMMGNRLVGIMGHPNSLAYFLVLILPFCIYLFITSEKIFKKFFLLIICGSITYTLILTYSRGAFIILFIMFLLILIFQFRINLKAAIPFILLFLLIFLLSPPKYIDRITSLTQLPLVIKNPDVTKPTSFKTRMVIIPSSINLFLDNILFGVGPGNFIDYYDEYFPPGSTASDPHNTFILIASELGLLGIILFIISIVYILKNILFMQCYDGDIKLISNTFLIVFLGLLIAFIFGAGAGIKLFWITIGSTIALKHMNLKE